MAGDLPKIIVKSMWVSKWYTPPTGVLLHLFPPPIKGFSGLDGAKGDAGPAGPKVRY